MITINITAKSTEGTVKQIQEIIGGTIIERWGEYVLSVNNKIATGKITFITFEWGGSVLEYDITFLEDIVLVMDTSEFNPIHFTYTSEGHSFHRFELEENKRKLAQFQSVIITSKDGGYNYGYFEKNVKNHIHLIQINRVNFIKKRLNDASQLNKRLYEVFHDQQHENVFAYFGTFNLKLANLIKKFNKVKQKGMIKILIKEGIIYQILSEHILQHNKDVKTNKQPNTSLSKKELNSVRKVAQKISNNVAEDYNVEELANSLGLPQAKLQEGFKMLFSRTVIEYIRHVRLEEARDLINNTDYNISQIVYSIGFSSRSYFSKIFKKKYGISPSKFLKNKQNAKIKTA
ncbi:helix-turn-helix domain-containing protein [Tenacibaculum aquimarinum]|uniref:helix-turn-helix domain-containing protein n=1 Tax=Tenacibaculum aquimarinum TaxID=2910675 RepID=UPI001F0A63CA|nr:AraC family transcriptional regulator [Tenacibaculum aquimarinum]MCH3882770.1 AraC family transcriptional regulator [Tenacibaculum aquimarinum]MCH3884952.1 AraC family transcriptional regulator [Tenacibaculum aquimarinum]